MTIAVDVNIPVAGYINTHNHNDIFTICDVNEYIRSLWDAGCGPVRLNFTQRELEKYLDQCVCVRKIPGGYRIDKSILNGDLENMTEEERAFFRNDVDIAKSFNLFCRLGVDFRISGKLLDYMGFAFIRTS